MSCIVPTLSGTTKALLACCCGLAQPPKRLLMVFVACCLQMFVYLAGLQLLLTSGRKTFLVMVASTLAGVLYRLNFCGVRRLRVRLQQAAGHAGPQLDSCLGLSSMCPLP
jgi:hypothetical protein